MTQQTPEPAPIVLGKTEILTHIAKSPRSSLHET